MLFLLQSSHFLCMRQPPNFFGHGCRQHKKDARFSLYLCLCLHVHFLYPLPSLPLLQTKWILIIFPQFHQSINSSICFLYGMVVAYHGKTWLETSANDYRTKLFYPTLERVGLLYASNGTKHTPHDCRHTFSWLCDRYKIDDMSKHLLMGHALGSDVEKNVYGHRTFDELKHEIEKICIPKH